MDSYPIAILSTRCQCHKKLEKREKTYMTPTNRHPICKSRPIKFYASPEKEERFERTVLSRAGRAAGWSAMSSNTSRWWREEEEESGVPEGVVAAA